MPTKNTNKQGESSSPSGSGKKKRVMFTDDIDDKLLSAYSDAKYKVCFVFQPINLRIEKQSYFLASRMQMVKRNGLKLQRIFLGMRNHQMHVSKESKVPKFFLFSVKKHFHLTTSFNHFSQEF